MDKNTNVYRLIQPCVDDYIVLNGDSILVLYVVSIIKNAQNCEECDDLVKHNVIYNINNIYF